MLYAKDGKWRQTKRDTTTRPRKIRALVASVAVVAGIGAFLLGRRALSAFFPRPRRRIATTATETDVRLQQLTRYRAADGRHFVRGTLVAEFEPDDRSAAVYVAFCPPFERLPTVEIEIVDDSFATAKISQLLHNGVQIDVRLPQLSDEKQSVSIEMMATESPDAEVLG